MARRGSSASSSSEPEEVEATVGDYPERPYSDVITDEQREALSAYGITVPDAAKISESAEE